jgi:hypothetical protein
MSFYKDKNRVVRTRQKGNNKDSPLMVAELMSGYWVEEWLPQMMQPVTSSTAAFALRASWPTARLWSRRVSAEKFSGFRFRI